MKCNSCGNEIAPNSVKCPICGAEISSTSVLPATPEKPALPQDQGTDNVITTAIPVVVPNEVDERVQVGNVELSTEPTPVTSQEVINDVASTMPPIESIDGVKENLHDMSTITEEVKPKKKKMTKKSLIKLIILVVVICLIFGIGYYLFDNITNTAKDRIGTLYNQAFAYINPTKIEEITNKSGNISMDLSIEGNINKLFENISIDNEDMKEVALAGTNNKLETTITNKYGIDVKNNKLYSNISFDKLKIGETEVNTLTDNTIYYYDSNVYINAPSIYNKYVLLGKSDKLPTNLGKVDFSSFIQTSKIAILNGIKQMPSSQSIGSRTINGESKKVNITKISINPGSMKRFYTILSESLKNNDSFVAEYAKFYNINEQEAISKLENLVNTDVSSANGYIEVYTSILSGSLFKTDVYGFKIVTKYKDTNYVINYTIKGTRALEVIADGKKVINIKYNRSTTNSNGNKQIIYKVNGSFIYKDEEYKISLDLKDTIDSTTLVEKINIKDAVDKNYIPAIDYVSIYTSLKNLNIFNGSQLDTIIEKYNQQVQPVEPVENQVNTQEVE